MTTSNENIEFADSTVADDSDRLVQGKRVADRDVVVAPAIDSNATEPVVTKDAYVAAHGASAASGGDPANDPTVPKRAPGGDHANESPESALAKVEIPGPRSNDQLGVAAEKRAQADGGRDDAPRDRRSSMHARTDTKSS